MTPKVLTPEEAARRAQYVPCRMGCCRLTSTLTHTLPVFYFILTPPTRRKKERDARLAASRAERHKRESEMQRQLDHLRRQQARAQRKRIRFLLGQSELFSHFMSAPDPESPRKVGRSASASSTLGSPKAGGAAGIASPSPSRRRRHSVEESHTYVEDGAFVGVQSCVVTLPPTRTLVCCGRYVADMVVGALVYCAYAQRQAWRPTLCA